MLLSHFLFFVHLIDCILRGSLDSTLVKASNASFVDVFAFALLLLKDLSKCQHGIGTLFSGDFVCTLIRENLHHHFSECGAYVNNGHIPHDFDEMRELVISLLHILGVLTTEEKRSGQEGRVIIIDTQWRSDSNDSLSLSLGKNRATRK